MARIDPLCFFCYIDVFQLVGRHNKKNLKFLFCFRYIKFYGFGTIYGILPSSRRHKIYLQPNNTFIITLDLFTSYVNKGTSKKQIIFACIQNLALNLSQEKTCFDPISSICLLWSPKKGDLRCLWVLHSQHLWLILVVEEEIWS